MIRRLLAGALLVAATVAGPGCAPAKTHLVASAPAPHQAAAALTALPGFVVVPAIDLRPPVERDGGSPEAGFVFATTGGAMGHHTGAAVLDGDDHLRWSGHAAFAGAATPSTAVASDLGRALASAAGRPVSYHARDADQAAAAAPDGSVVVTVVIDHLTQITPRNHDFSQTKSQQGNYEVTTTSTATESFGPFWTFTLRVQLAEVRGGRIARRLVRYASATSLSASSYSDVIGLAAYQVVEAVATEWSPVDVVVR